MDLHLSLGPSEKLTLTGAILVYRGARQAFAAWHRAITNSDGAPTLGEAESLSTEFLRVLSAGLGAYVAPEILPAPVLVRMPRCSSGGRLRSIGHCSSPITRKGRGR